MTGKGLDRIEKLIDEFLDSSRKSGVLENERRRQDVEWFRTLLKEEVLGHFFAGKDRCRKVEKLEELVGLGRLAPSAAVEDLFNPEK